MTSTGPIAHLPAGILAAQLGLPGAWQRVQAKAGMPGADGVAVRTFASTVPAAIRRVEEELATGVYRSLPLRLVEMEKKN